MLCFRIHASVYATGVQDYYSVEAILYFFMQVSDPKTDSFETYLRLALANDKQYIRQADYEPLHRYLHAEDSILPAQIDKDFTAEREKELVILLAGMRRDEAADFSSAVIKQEIKTEPEPGENPNREVLVNLKEHLMEAWGMHAEQAVDSVQQLISCVEALPASLSRLRVEYAGVPKHRELFREIICERVAAKVRELGHGGGEQESVAIMKTTLQSLQCKAMPKTVGEMASFLSLSTILSSDVRGHQPEAMEAMLALLNAPCIDKAAGALYASTDQHKDTFETVKESLSAIGSLKPAAAAAPMIVYAGLADNCFCSFVIQLQAGLEKTRV